MITKNTNKMKTINDIIARKKTGIDCTENESAEIKGVLRELGYLIDRKLLSDIQEWFPLEYGEFLEEINIK